MSPLTSFLIFCNCWLILLIYIFWRHTIDVKVILRFCFCCKYKDLIKHNLLTTKCIMSEKILYITLFLPWVLLQGMHADHPSRLNLIRFVFALPVAFFVWCLCLIPLLLWSIVYDIMYCRLKIKYNNFHHYGGHGGSGGDPEDQGYRPLYFPSHELFIARTDSKKQKVDCPSWWKELEKRRQNQITNLVRGYGKNNNLDKLALSLQDSIGVDLVDAQQFLKWWFAKNSARKSHYFPSPNDH